MAYYNNYKSKGSFQRYKAPVIEKKPRFYPPNGWLPQFEDVFEFLLNGEGHGAVEAVAGAGKTSCLVEALYRYFEKFPHHAILVLAFNRSIRVEFQSRAPDGVAIETCHSFNFKSVCKVWGDGRNVFELQGPKGTLAFSLAENAIGDEAEKQDDRESLCQTMSLAKTRLAENEQDILDIMEKWGIETTYARKEFAKHVLKMMDETKKRPGSAGKGKGAKKVISYDDQVWLPIVNGWVAVYKYDVVLIDEAQDLSPARTQVAIRALKPGGRILAVGDRFQALYSFAGADIDALPDLIKTLNAKTFPLTCSFRCAKNIIAEAQQYNPAIEASPNAPDGIVDEMTRTDMIDKAMPGSAIISRTNAPLIKLFFKLAKAQKKVRLLGKDYGAMLAFRINGWRKVAKRNGEAFTLKVLLRCNEEWYSEQCEEYAKKKNLIERFTDEYETILALSEDISESINSTEAVDELMDRMKNMFSEDEEKGSNKDNYCITLSSTHKFKGLERDRVFVLIDTYKPGENQEETNCAYVAVTRARNHLTYVHGK